VLSGIGGDEVMGGVPTPTPELEDLLARGHLRTLAHQLKVWALNKRKPWFHLLFDAARGFLPPALVSVPKYKQPPPWLNQDFVKRNREALQGYESGLKLFGPLPTFQENMNTLNVLQRQLACDALPWEPFYEKRHPYLDRGLLEFMYAIPREQLVRPGQRRSLMRRALIGIVPNDLLNRKRKAFVVRKPMINIQTESATLEGLTQRMVAGSLAILDQSVFRHTLQMIRQGRETHFVAFVRSVELEYWLQHVGEYLPNRGVPTSFETRLAGPGVEAYGGRSPIQSEGGIRGIM
jgi:asparagine synthase (glutamine-hydrolysing)